MPLQNRHKDYTVNKKLAQAGFFQIISYEIAKKKMVATSQSAATPGLRGH